MDFYSLKTYFSAEGGQIVTKQTLSVFAGAVLHCVSQPDVLCWDAALAFSGMKCHSPDEIEQNSVQFPRTS